MHSLERDRLGSPKEEDVQYSVKQHRAVYFVAEKTAYLVRQFSKELGRIYWDSLRCVQTGFMEMAIIIKR